MSRPLKILHLEDLPEDAELVARAIRRAGIAEKILHVDNREAFIKALNEFEPDVIISDHSLPSLNSHEALKLIKERGIEVPFILVTATVSEEYAVTIIKEGASDYILKDRLQRLPNAIEAALEKFRLAKENKRSHEELKASERKYKLLFESNPMPMWIVSQKDMRIIDVNAAAIKHYSYSREEFLQFHANDLLTEDEEQTGIWKHQRKDGSFIKLEMIAHDIIYEDQPAKLILTNDITEKLRAEAELARQRKMRQKLITETSIKAQEREREAIGIELHDNINQLLAAAKLYMDYAITKDKLQSERLEQSRENISQAIAEIRKLSKSLVAPSLGDETLVHIIQSLLNDFRLTTSLQIELVADHLNEAILSDEEKLMFYRIMQEQMNNIIKHAKAKKVIITFETTSSETRLSVQDDGVGFDTSRHSPGIGLRNISTRASNHDGKVNIISSVGNGCLLEVSIPFK